MITPELTAYIKEALRRKMSFETIKSELLRVGWELGDITRCYDMVFNELHGATPSAISQQPSPIESTQSPISTISPIEAIPVSASAPFVEQVSTAREPVRTTSAPSSVANNAPKKKGSFTKVFALVSLLVVIGLAGAVYAGVFVSDSLINKAILRGVADRNAFTNDISFSFRSKANQQESQVFDVLIKGISQSLPKQFSYTIQAQGGDPTQSLALDLVAKDDVVYIHTKDLPESFSEELVIYENQWFRLPLTQKGIDEVSSGQLPIPSSVSKGISTAVGIDDVTQYQALLTDVSLLKLIKKESIILDGGQPQYQILADIDYDGLQTLISKIKESNPTLDSGAFLDGSFIKNALEGKLAVRMWIGVLDGKIKKIEFVYTDSSENADIVLRGAFGFPQKMSSEMGAVPESSYEFAEFTEKARSGLIPNLMIGNVPYAEFWEAKNRKAEEERIQAEKIAYLTMAVENDSASSYFLENKKSFVGVCSTFSIDFICRDSRSGFILYTEIKQLGDPLPQYACIDAYTKDSYTVLANAPKKLRCE